MSCTACELHQYRTQVVPGHGNIEARIAYIGEAPGAVEDREGKPFLGPAGQHLRKLTAIVGLDPNDIWWDNVLNCRPPNNNFRGYPDSVVKCPKLWLLPILDSLPNLRVIVVFGANAGGATWFPGKKAGEMANLARVLPDGKIVVGSYHPSYAIRGVAGIDDSIKQSLARAFSYAYLR